MLRLALLSLLVVGSHAFQTSPALPAVVAARTVSSERTRGRQCHRIGRGRGGIIWVSVDESCRHLLLLHALLVSLLAHSPPPSLVPLSLSNYIYI